MEMEHPSEVVRGFYEFCRGQMQRLMDTPKTCEKFFMERLTFEQAFWINFTTIALCTWSDDAEYEIRLSEIFRVYLTIYCEEIDRNMKVKDEPSFLRLLKEKYDRPKKILFEKDESKAGLYLARLALGEASYYDVIKTIYIAMEIPGVAAATSPLPFKLIEDV